MNQPQDWNELRVLVLADICDTHVDGVVTTNQAVSKVAPALIGQYRMVMARPGYGTKLWSEQIPLTWFEPGLYAPNPFTILKKTRAFIDEMNPHILHIPVEGVVGLVAQRVARERNIPYTTAWHSNWPEFLWERLFLPPSLTNRYLRRFHDGAACIFATNASMAERLLQLGLPHTRVIGRGVDLNIFHPNHNTEALRFDPLKYERPFWVIPGRVAKEKGLERAFTAKLPGTIFVIGDGKYRSVLERRYPKVVFLGEMDQLESARHQNIMNVMLFTSTTDTFGLVMPEANGCGLPVAAYNVTGPDGYVVDGVNGFLSNEVTPEGLREMAMKCLTLQERDPGLKDRCINEARNHDWRQPTMDMVDTWFSVARSFR